MSDLKETALEVVKSSSLDIIKKAAGYIFQPFDNHHEAIIFLKSRISDAEDLNDIAKAAYMSDANRIIREYKNQHDVVNEALNYFAAPSLPERNSSSNDTIFKILNDARIVTEDETRILLAKILAGELETPNSVPKALINAISSLSVVQAHQLRFLSFFIARKMRNGKSEDSPFLILPKTILPIIVWYRKDNLEIPFVIDEDALFDMQRLTILIYGTTIHYEFFSKFELHIPLLSHYNVHYKITESDAESNGVWITMDIGKAKLTSSGEYLFNNLINNVCLDDYHFDRKKEQALRRLADDVDLYLNRNSSQKLIKTEN